MTLSAQTASTMVIIGMSVVAAWGAFLSVRSARLGPRWALRNLRSGIIAGAVLTAVGLAAVLLIRPVWMGAGLAYIGFVVVWLSWMVNRSLRRAAALGLHEPLAAERRRAVLAKSSRGLLTAAGVIALIALFDLSVRGPAALPDLILVAALAIPGWTARRA